MRRPLLRGIGRRSLLAIALVALSAAALSALAAGAPGPGGAGPPGSAAEPRNPCTSPGSGDLLCPDLRVGPAEDLYVEGPGHGGGGEHAGHDHGDAYRSHHGGRTLLHAANDIRSRGLGPVELRGHRYRPGWMRANQAIHRRAGGVRIFRTGVRMRFYYVGRRNGGWWWKVHNPLSMEVWSIDDRGRPQRRLRKGPKVYYCFRDLERTRPGPRSPREPVYPACSQDRALKHTRMGTSVGWSDIYPNDYNRQWVDVTGLPRGCYAFVMRVDPANLIFESNERNNRSTHLFRLPYRPGPQRCP